MNYTITGTGPFILTDNSGGSPDGTDTVTNVENFQFSNGTFTAAQIVNDTPTAVGDTANAVEAGGVNNGTAGTNPLGNVLGNDTDPDSALGDTKAVQGVASGTPGGPLSTGVGATIAGSFGSLVLNADGGYSYTLDNANASVQALNAGNQLTDTFTYTMRDAAGATSTATLAVTIDGANDAPSTPVDANGAANSVAEGAANGTTVGIAASSSDVDGPSVHYSLTDDAGGRFAIDTNTGVVTVANGALLDFETATSHQITVQASDGTLTATQAFTIAITDVVEGGGSSGFFRQQQFQFGRNRGGARRSTTLTGGGGNDNVSGGDGADSLAGGAGGDTVVAGNGNDSVSGGTGGDSIDAGDGQDTVGGDAGNDIVFGWGGNDFLDGGDGSDTINGGAGNDSLEGDSGKGNDSLAGGTGDDTLDGGTGNDTMDGGAGADSMIGGLGNDTYVVDGLGDAIVENAGEGTDIEIVTNAGAYTLAANVEKLFAGGLGDFALTGNSGTNTIAGGAGNDTLYGGGGTDRLVGGAGDDTYLIDSPIVVIREGAGSIDTVLTSLSSFTLASNVENLSYTLADWVTPGSGDFTGAGNNAANKIVGGDGNDNLLGLNGNDTLDGGAGANTLAGGLGNDTYYVGASDVVNENPSEGTDTVITALANFTLAANVENLTYTGSADLDAMGNAGNNSLAGGAGNDSLSGLDGNDTLDGGAGADTMAGGLGNDTYTVDDAGDSVNENPGEGTDTVNTALSSYTLTGNVERLNYTGSGDFTGSGNAIANTIAGGAGNDNLLGLEGNDTMDGGAGADTMAGGLGNDTYTVDDAGDSVNENPGEGTDTVKTTLSSYTLGSNLENLTYTGAGDFTGTGNVLANTITGASGNDSLDGGNGNDRLHGGSGTDTLSGGNGNDQLYGEDGNDSLYGGEGNDTLDGGAGNDTMTGGTGSDKFVFTAADGPSGGAVLGEIADFSSSDGDKIDLTFDAIDGGPVDPFSFIGSGAFAGVAGQLRYAIDGSGGVNIEGDTNGDSLADFSIAVDGVSSLVDSDFVTHGIDTDAASFTLAPTTQNLIYTGAGDFAGTGNGLANAITGNIGEDTLTGLAGNDTLDGGAGDDSLIGGLGNDTYVVDSPSDLVVENPGEGTDTELVTTAGTYTLADNVEKMTFTGAGDFSGIGNADGNTIMGGDGNDTLYGAGGADRLAGGAGDDTYLVDDAGETVSEGGRAGSDTVLTTLANWTLSGNVENLTYTGPGFTGAGAGDFTGTGNSLANVIVGGSGDDSLSGLKGDDTLMGGAGNDTLDGGAGKDEVAGGLGADRFVFKPGDPASGDKIADFSHAEGDSIDLSQIDAVSGGGDDPFAFIGAGAFSHVAGQLHYVVTATGVTVQGDIDGDGKADFSIAVDGVSLLATSDFIL